MQSLGELPLVSGTMPKRLGIVAAAFIAASCRCCYAGASMLSEETKRVPRLVAAAATMTVLVVVCAPIFYQLGRWPLMDPDEGRNAEIGREMLALGSWALPHFNGLPFLDKPPLLFWSIAAAFHLLGETEFAARLPSAIAALALVALAMDMGRLLLDWRSALWVGVIVGTTPLVLVYGRLTIFDMPFTALTTAAVVCLLRRRLGGRDAIWLPLAALAIGLAVLTKGPVGIAVPLLAWLAGRGALPQPVAPVQRGSVVLAVLVGMALVLPWLVLVVRAEPGFLRYALIDETFLRFTSEARFHRGEPPWYPLVVSALGMGIWTVVLIGTAPTLARGIGATERQRVAIRFASRAAAIIIIFFSISASKRPGYVLPAFAPLAVLVVVGLRIARRRAATSVRVAAFGALAAAATFVAIECEPSALAALTRHEAAADVLTRPLLLAVAGLCLAWSAAVLGAGSARSLKFGPAPLAAIFAPALSLLVQRPMAPYAEARSARSIAAALPADAPIVSFRHFRPSLPFYLRRPVLLASNDGRELTSNYVSSRSERFFASGDLMRPQDARSMIRRKSRIYVLTGASWENSVPRFRDVPVSLVAKDRRSAVWYGDK